MVNRTTVQFFLNQEQAKDAKTVMKTLKNAGGVPEDISLNQVAKSVFNSFVSDMTGKKKEEPEEAG
ncbi:unnamed protein product [marine sediment metagenome]|uniref:Uncharacterized protein n=1 Tax=marine sediment metagenome TaxID=412755 RepID=X1AVT8_9ZZZZ